ncbi:MAG TPA: hypothetical protein VML19_26795 [Verrucomicrobiae bacterium]|nr:hypothetical protein [Verrucomicrobiae bacterium]
MSSGARSTFGDSAPRQSPVLVPLSLSGALAITLAVSGATAHVSGCPPGCDPLDGGDLTQHQYAAGNGIAQIIAPFESLIGVFLADAPPDKSRAPRPYRVPKDATRLFLANMDGFEWNVDSTISHAKWEMPAEPPPLHTRPRSPVARRLLRTSSRQRRPCRRRGYQAGGSRRRVGGQE